MKYFVAHLLSGDVKTYHERLTRDIAYRYGVYPLHERVLPHITVKAPFECDEEGIKEVERVLRSFAHSETSAPYTIKGFGRFGFRTAYLDVYKSPEAVALLRRAIRTVNDNVSWIPRAPLEGNKLHASVARFMTRKQSRRVDRYLRAQHAFFRERLDNFAILKKEGKKWMVETIIALRAPAPLFTGSQFDESPVLV
ncbi:2'-5' RNA ligase family protein [Patescibacteria group bacterium]|nr:2'-5' RNA ligase family protein [Patescibacteria group bacterium]